MKSKIIIVCSVAVSIILVALISLFYNESSDNNIISNISKNKEVISSNMITMMYETDAGTGIYEETKDTTWPESGYIFNDILSGCENGGELEYNSQNNTVNLLSNFSDRCYVYFDKYDGVWIDNVVATNVTGSSVTLDVSATSENGSITTYYYALNDSEEYQESTSNIITINNLNNLTKYKIRIYAVDSTNSKSNIYEINVSTTDESRPVINSVEVSNITYNSITISIDAISDFEIKRYYSVINDNITNGVVSYNNIITLNNLKPNTTYNIEVFVENNNGTYSDKYTISITTLSISLATYIKDFIYEEDGVNGLYHHDGLGLYENEDLELQDNSYRYSGGDYILNNTSYDYIFGDLIKYQCGSNNNYDFSEYCSNSTQYFYLSYDSTKSQYSSLKTIIEQAINDNYIRYQINNYVCFGSNENQCPYDNLYRIIGVFDDNVKLVKADFGDYDLLGRNGDYGITYPYSNTYRGIITPYIPGYFWNYRNQNSSNKLWQESYLNTINLNQNYINNIGEEWANKISTHTWKVGNLSENNQYIAKQYFEEERNLSNYNAKVALMYLSDFGYATTPSYWNISMINLGDINILENNWIHLGGSENLLAKSTTNPIRFDNYGYIDFGDGFNGVSATRPCFYLNSDVAYISGDGSINFPFRIE